MGTLHVYKNLTTYYLHSADTQCVRWGDCPGASYHSFAELLEKFAINLMDNQNRVQLANGPPARVKREIRFPERIASKEFNALERLVTAHNNNITSAVA